MIRHPPPGATAPDPHPRGRHRRALAGLTAVALVATTASVLTAGTAFAAIPTAPDNLLVFPNRDFITIEGYQSHAGEVGTIELTRAGQIVGSAQGTVSGGDVAFEINHPGGVCWGAGTGVNVTPDIQPGDIATIKFGGTAFGDSTVQSAGFPGAVPTPTTNTTTKTTVDGDTLTVEGVIDPANNAPDPANMEQRIVNPDGFRTSLGKRDIRAVPGDFVTAPKTGTLGTYKSKLAVGADGKTFTATYVFEDPAVATVARDGGGQRLLQWQTVDPAGNRQGVSIAEAGEVGGPGFGGCPSGPGDAAAPAAGSAAVIRSADKTSAKVTWSAATAQPGATAVSGYSVEAIATTASAAGEKPGVVVRTGAAATSTTLALDPAVTYDVEVRSLAGTGLSAPYTIGAVAGTATGAPEDTVIPILTVTPAGGTEAAPAAATSVTATSDNGQIFYTDDGSLATFGDGPSSTAKLYTGPVAITKAANLSFAAFDTAGNSAKAAQDGWYTPDAAAGTTTGPTGLKATAGPGQVTLAWTAVPNATGYQVVAYQADGTTKLATQPPANTGTSQVITGLATGDYKFTVTAKNAAGTVSPESAQVSATVTAVADTVAISKVTWKAGAELRVIGSTSATTGTVTIYAAKTDATGKLVADTTKPLISNAALTSAAPAAGSSFDARSGAKLNARPATQVVAKLSTGSESAAVTVP
jgi:hypothetical protein